MRAPLRVAPVLLLACILVFTGCRTYGDEGYETGPKTYEAYRSTIQQLEQELSRAQSDLRRLEAVADTVEGLTSLADRYRSLVHTHETALESHKKQAEELSPGSAYRTLNRSYGALVTDRRLLQRQYQRTVHAVRTTIREPAVQEGTARRQSSYSITPPDFPGVGDEGRLSMAEALRGAAVTPGLQSEESTPES